MNKLLEAVDQQASRMRQLLQLRNSLMKRCSSNLCQKILYGIFIRWVRNSMWPRGEMISWPLLGNFIMKWKTVSSGIFYFVVWEVSIAICKGLVS